MKKHIIVFDRTSQKYNTTGLMSLLEMPMQQHTNFTSKTGVPRFVLLFACRHVEKDAARGQHEPLILRADFILIIRPIIIILSFAQQIIMVVASWQFSHGENRLDPEL